MKGSQDSKESKKQQCETGFPLSYEYKQGRVLEWRNNSKASNGSWPNIVLHNLSKYSTAAKGDLVTFQRDKFPFPEA